MLPSFMKRLKSELPLRDAVRVKSAETWLHMGEPAQALLELKKLTRKAWRHPWTEQVMWKTAQAMG